MIRSDTAVRRLGDRRAAKPVPALRRRQPRANDGDHALELYVRQIGKLTSLTPAEETLLARRVQRGDRKAREQLLKASLPLVVGIARNYEDIGLPLLDLVSEGNLGLIKAIERFDPAKQGEFPAHSSWWIKQSIKRALAAGKSAR